MDEKLILTVSPHIRSTRTTQKIMLDVIIALSPTVIAAILIFGWKSIAVLATAVAACLLCEYFYNLITKKENICSDLSAVVTGLLLGLGLPSDLPLWQIVIGSVFAIIVAKCLFGGLGKNFANPAIVGRVVMILAFSSAMSNAPAFWGGADAVSSATPLAVIGAGNASSLVGWKLFLGLHSGSLGETCTLAILLGGIYLLCRKVITWHAPVVFILTVFVGSLLVTGSFRESLLCIFSGGLFISAVFMATDYVTTPYTPWGKVIFGFGCGLITFLIRFWGSYPEGVSFAVLFMNLLTPYIEKWTRRKPLGGLEA